MIRRLAKVSTAIAAISLFAVSCGQSSNDDSQIATSGYGSSIELITGAYDTFLKRSLTTDTKLEDGRGSEFCTLYANSKYELFAQPTRDGKHHIVKIIGFTERGCGFSSGYVFSEHVTFKVSNSEDLNPKPVDITPSPVNPASSGPKIVNFMGKQVVIGVVRDNSLTAKEKAFLDMIAAAEGTSNTLSSCGKADDGYKSIFGCDRSSSNLFYDYGAHPQRAYATGWGTYSDASGRYQFKSTTWNELAAKHGIYDFSPASQDKGAILKVRERGSNPNNISNFDSFNNTVYGVRLEWASMPHSPYGQKTYDASPLYDLYLQALDLY